MTVCFDRMSVFERWRIASTYNHFFVTACVLTYALACFTTMTCVLT